MADSSAKAKSVDAWFPQNSERELNSGCRNYFQSLMKWRPSESSMYVHRLIHLHLRVRCRMHIQAKLPARIYAVSWNPPLSQGTAQEDNAPSEHFGFQQRRMKPTHPLVLLFFPSTPPFLFIYLFLFEILNSLDNYVPASYPCTLNLHVSWSRHPLADPSHLLAYFLRPISRLFGSIPLPILCVVIVHFSSGSRESVVGKSSSKDSGESKEGRILGGPSSFSTKKFNWRNFSNDRENQRGRENCDYQN